MLDTRDNFRKSLFVLFYILKDAQALMEAPKEGEEPAAVDSLYEKTEKMLKDMFSANIGLHHELDITKVIPMILDLQEQCRSCPDMDQKNLFPRDLRPPEFWREQNWWFIRRSNDGDPSHIWYLPDVESVNRLAQEIRQAFSVAWEAFKEQKEVILNVASKEGPAQFSVSSKHSQASRKVESVSGYPSLAGTESMRELSDEKARSILLTEDPVSQYLLHMMIQADARSDYTRPKSDQSDLTSADFSDPFRLTAKSHAESAPVSAQEEWEEKVAYDRFAACQLYNQRLGRG
jgi:hypothetical protein